MKLPRRAKSSGKMIEYSNCERCSPGEGGAMRLLDGLNIYEVQSVLAGYVLG